MTFVSTLNKLNNPVGDVSQFEDEIVQIKHLKQSLEEANIEKK